MASGRAQLITPNRRNASNDARRLLAKAWRNIAANVATSARYDGELVRSFNGIGRKPTGSRTSVAEVAKMRGVSPEQAVIDLVLADQGRVGAIYFLMSEENVRREAAIPWVSFGSDGEASAPEGVFLKSTTHPRAYGNFASFLGKYVRDEKIVPLSEGVRRLTSLPSSNLGLRDRGLLKPGMVADVVLFDPATIADHATFAKPMQFATGVHHVFINGVQVLKDGEPTGAKPGRFVKGAGWKGWPNGGACQSRDD